jgi:N-acetylneuraminic acid mutarotase
VKKRRTAQSGVFSLRLILCAAAVCSIITGTPLAFFRSDSPTNASQRTLTFAERVAYQRAIEEVYWRHRIWPRERSDPKPSFDAVMSQAQLERKVHDYLRKSRALQDYWQRPITSEQLQAEMDRMAKHTKQPEVLRELFEALGNDPFVIAECLARPAIADQLMTNSYAYDAPPLESRRVRRENQMPKLIAAPIGSYTLPTISSGAACADDTWTATSTTNAPGARVSHTAVWTGSEMIVWGGYGGSYFNNGGRYNPSTDSWAAISPVNAPSARGGHTAVWTGNEMIVWGGDDGHSLNTGGRYNPATDTWTATNTTSAPVGRLFHTAVWSGSQMVVWGGWNEFELNTGSRYDPSTDSWTATSAIGAPAARLNHSAVWADSEMIVWGGWNGVNYFNTGGKYNPSTDRWAATATSNAPSGRKFHTAEWTGNEMVVWAGDDGSNFGLNSGGRYNPGTNNWAVTSTTNAPGARFSHTAVWTGSDMIVWGGTDGLKQFDSGGRYNPDTDNWMATTTTKAAERRSFHTAVWSGSEMIVWGGLNDIGPFYLNTGGRYCAQPSPTPTVTPMESCLVEHVSSCNAVVFIPPTDFTVQMSCPVETVQPSGFMVNNIGPNSFTVSESTITFHYNTSPAMPGANTIHILFDAIICCLRPVSEFTCTFTYSPDTPTPTPTVTSIPTPSPRSTPLPRPRPTPHLRP